MLGTLTNANNDYGTVVPTDYPAVTIARQKIGKENEEQSDYARSIRNVPTDAKARVESNRSFLREGVGELYFCAVREEGVLHMLPRLFCGKPDSPLSPESSNTWIC